MPDVLFHIPVSKTARVAANGELTLETKKLWFVLHGYGELAPYFIRKFNKLTYPENVVVAPEAFSRFYLNGFSGRVGATWMTKEDRNTDINDYIAYLNHVWKMYQDKMGNRTVEIYVLGFSQGAATASRWVAMGNMLPHKLFLHSGVFPPDLPLEASEKFKQIKEVVLLAGNSDKLITQEQLNKQEEEMKKEGVNLKVVNYNGGHEINQDALLLFTN